MLARPEPPDATMDAIDFAERVDATIRASDASTDGLDICASIGSARADLAVTPSHPQG